MGSIDIKRLMDTLDRGRMVEAITLATELVRQYPANVTGHVVRARALESQGDYREALLAWREAFDLLPNSPIIDKGLRRTAEKLSLERERKRPAEPMDDDLTSDGPLPGFENVGSVFDVPESFERISDDLTQDVDPEDAKREAALTAAVEAVERLETESQHRSARDPRRGETLESELDGLISDLSEARITPSDRSFPTPDLDSPIEDVATETLARIYAAQKQYQEAARVYTRLADLRPDSKDEFLRRASEMRQRADRS